MRLLKAMAIMCVLSPLLAGESPQENESQKWIDLPDPFVMQDGTRIKTPEQWDKLRRPELLQLFQTHVYGFLPPSGDIEATVTKTVPDLLDGRATLKEVAIRFPFLDCERAPVLHLALIVPNDADGPVPVFLGLNSRGNQVILPDVRITPTSDAGEPQPRGARTDFWCVSKLIDRGYAFATFDQDDVDFDEPGSTKGVQDCLDYEGIPKESRAGTIACWAWGFHRAVDYLVSDPAIDDEGICIIGHSRRGKTALFAAATDPRIDLVVPHQSGTGGMALSRDNNQETVARINKHFPHWFCDRFNDYNDNEEALPVDQHLLVALVAPRYLLDTAGLKDTWANYPSALANLRAADAVYEFLGKRGLVGDGVLTKSDEFTNDTAGEIAQYRLDTKHTLNCAYWNAILDFADLRLSGGE